MDDDIVACFLGFGVGIIFGILIMLLVFGALDQIEQTEEGMRLCEKFSEKTDTYVWDGKDCYQKQGKGIYKKLSEAEVRALHDLKIVWEEQG